VQVFPNQNSRTMAETQNKATSRPNERKVGKRRVVNVGDRLSRSQMALRAHMDRGTLAKYLAMEGAPKPDERELFSYTEVMAWIQRNAPTLASSEELRKLKESILRMEADDKAIDLAVKRGRLVDKMKIVPAVAAFNTQLTDDLRTKFEMELPPKYEGKSRIERQQMNADAIDWVLRRLKAGQHSLTYGVEKADANVIGEGNRIG
jgi:hypothetical protein